MAAGRAGPPGAKVLRDVLAALRTGWPPGLTVLTGEDLYHLEAAQKAILGYLIPDGSDSLTLTVLGDGPVDARDVVAAASSRGMFAARRVVLVREADALSGERGVLEAFAARPPSDGFLLVRARRLDLRRATHREMESAGRVLCFRAPLPEDEAALAGEIAAMARERGLALPREGAAHLLDLSGGDLYRVASELDKVRAWLGADAKEGVSMEVLRNVGSGAGAVSSWEAADALEARDHAAMVAALRGIAETEEPIRIVGGMAYRARTMLLVKAMLECKRPPAAALAAARVWRGKNELLAGVRRYSLQELLRFPSRLLAADRTLKSRGVSPGAVLEALAADLVSRGTGGSAP